MLGSRADKAYGLAWWENCRRSNGVFPLLALLFTRLLSSWIPSIGICHWQRTSFRSSFCHRTSGKTFGNLTKIHKNSSKCVYILNMQIWDFHYLKEFVYCLNLGTRGPWISICTELFKELCQGSWDAIFGTNCSHYLGQKLERRVVKSWWSPGTWSECGTRNSTLKSLD